MYQKNAIYYILMLLPRYMIGLRSNEWDMILGGIEAFRANEYEWMKDERDGVRKDAEKTIAKLDELYDKVRIIWKTMRHFEELMNK